VEPVLIVGLGNPGESYAATRHNVGFRVVDSLVLTLKTRRVKTGGDYRLVTARGEGRPVLLMQPLTYMNNSGTAVAEVLERYAVPLESMLVVVDDLALPLGKLRIRKRGSDGGHNGLFSIGYSLQTTEFPRLRCGIGVQEMPAKRAMADFVLSPFSDREAPAAERMISAATDIALTFARSGLQNAVQQCSLV
jgi:PTH1 family peptidyl-tRNA hydrolase